MSDIFQVLSNESTCYVGPGYRKPKVARQALMALRIQVVRPSSVRQIHRVIDTGDGRRVIDMGDRRRVINTGDCRLIDMSQDGGVGDAIPSILVNIGFDIVGCPVQVPKHVVNIQVPCRIVGLVLRDLFPLTINPLHPT
jgi:hypothetical protein